MWQRRESESWTGAIPLRSMLADLSFAIRILTGESVWKIFKNCSLLLGLDTPRGGLTLRMLRLTLMRECASRTEAGKTIRLQRFQNFKRGKIPLGVAVWMPSTRRLD